jgi:hypothetical protein
MDRPSSSGVSSRRSFIRLATIAWPASCLLAQTEFWNGKDPRNYSDDEKHQILNNSPWAKTARAEAPGGDSIQPVGDFNCRSAPPSGSGTCGQKPTAILHASPPPEAARESLAFYGQVTVRWESAKPILEVTRMVLPDQFRNHYVISVTGLPVSVLSNTSNGTPLPTAVLSMQRRPPEPAEFVALTSAKVALLFAFPKRNPVIAATDKTLSFTMNLSGIKIKTTFDPEKMVYRGLLEL